jgi:hypothetical protein
MCAFIHWQEPQTPFLGHGPQYAKYRCSRPDNSKGVTPSLILQPNFRKTLKSNQRVVIIWCSFSRCSQGSMLTCQAYLQWQFKELLRSAQLLEISQTQSITLRSMRRLDSRDFDKNEICR